MPRLLALLVLAACKANGVPPPEGPDATVIAADVRVNDRRADRGTTYPRRVLFARVKDDALEIEALAWSNYARGTRAYLFNAPPGRWVVACAVPYVDGKDHLVFLPENVVRASLREVPGGGVVSLGTIVVAEGTAWSQADEVQRRFHARVAANRPKPNVWREIFPKEIDFRGEYGRHEADDGRIENDVRKQIRHWGWEK